LLKQQDEWRHSQQPVGYSIAISDPVEKSTPTLFTLPLIYGDEVTDWCKRGIATNVDTDITYFDILSLEHQREYAKALDHPMFRHHAGRINDIHETLNSDIEDNTIFTLSDLRDLEGEPIRVAVSAMQCGIIACLFHMKSWQVPITLDIKATQAVTSFIELNAAKWIIHISS